MIVMVGQLNNTSVSMHTIIIQTKNMLVMETHTMGGS